jgi:hypothetical protein
MLACKQLRQNLNQLGKTSEVVENYEIHVGFEVLTAVSTKMDVFWVVVW